MAFVVVAIFAAGAILKGSSDDKAPADVSDNNKIIQDAFGRAKAAGTIPAWDGFLQQFSSGPLADEARRERTVRFAVVREAFNRAKAQDTWEAWDGLLREFPDVDGEQLRQAREKLKVRMEEAFALAKSSNSIQAWDKFLARFPSGPHADEARQERQKLDFARREKEAFDLAKAGDTIPAWNEFLRQFPSGPHADEAREERQKLALANRAHTVARYSTILPPAKYDVPYTGLLKIWISPLPVIEYFCKGASHTSCAFPLSGRNECRILILQPIAEGKHFDTLTADSKAAVHVKGNLALTLRHELGHCNGWPAGHPDGRKTYVDEPVIMPKLPTTTQVACVAPDRTIIDCKIAKPWWPQTTKTLP
jgi:hypothetical protein